MRKHRSSKPRPPQPKKPPPRFATELIRWEYVPRHSRKGYLNRDFCIGGKWYRWTSNSVSSEGLIRHGVLDLSHAFST